MSNFDKPRFAGRCMGVDLVDRGDGHICFVLCVEDDELWHRAKDNGTSSYWLDELIEQLTKARDFIKTQEPHMYEGRQWGYDFRKKEG